MPHMALGSPKTLTKEQCPSLRWLNLDQCQKPHSMMRGYGPSRIAIAKIGMNRSGGESMSEYCVGD